MRRAAGSSGQRLKESTRRKDQLTKYRLTFVLRHVDSVAQSIRSGIYEMPSVRHHALPQSTLGQTLQSNWSHKDPFIQGYAKTAEHGANLLTLSALKDQPTRNLRTRNLVSVPRQIPSSSHRFNRAFTRLQWISLRPHSH